MDICNVIKKGYMSTKIVQGTYCYNIPEFIIKEKYGFIRYAGFSTDILEMVTFWAPGIEYLLVYTKLSLATTSKFYLGIARQQKKIQT